MYISLGASPRSEETHSYNVSDFPETIHSFDGAKLKRLVNSIDY